MSEKFVFKPQKSALRYFNPETSYYSYRTFFIGPTLNYAGKFFNFLNNEDCEVLSDFGNTKKWRAHPPTRRAKAIAKLIPSTIGASIRGIAQVTDHTVYGLMHPIYSFKKLTRAGQPKGVKISRFAPFDIVGPKDPPKTSSTTNIESLKTLTINVGMLRKQLWSMNNEFNDLRPPQERVDELITKIKEELNDNDIICLQEAFEPSVQKRILEALQDEYPYAVANVGMRNFPSPNSGLMILSKHPIVDAKFQRYPNLFGEDTLSNKGFLGAKIRMGNEYVTVYNTHTQAGGGFLKKYSNFLEKLRRRKPDLSESRRNEQFALIHEHMQDWSEIPPFEGAEHLDTLVMGDMNSKLNDQNHAHGVSDPSGRCVSTTGEVVHQGKNKLFSELNTEDEPSNFYNIDIEHPLYEVEIEGQKHWVEKIPTKNKDEFSYYLLSIENNNIKRVNVTELVGESIIALPKSPNITKGQHPLKLELAKTHSNATDHHVFGTVVATDALRKTTLAEAIKRLEKKHKKAKSKKAQDKIKNKILQKSQALKKCELNLETLHAGQSGDRFFIDANYSVAAKKRKKDRGRCVSNYRQIVEMKSKEGKMISDHHGVSATYQYKPKK